MEVKIEIVHDADGKCSGECAFRRRDNACFHECAINLEAMDSIGCLPGPDCPGPGTYDLRKVVDDA